MEFSNFNIDLADRKMNRYCGSKEDAPKKKVESDGSFFRVTFKSNDVYDAVGFEAFFQFKKPETEPIGSYHFLSHIIYGFDTHNLWLVSSAL